jgi:hypothetical protein
MVVLCKTCTYTSGHLTLGESLETFNPEDVSVVAADGSRETIYNYEWVECIDEVIHALNGCTDIPVALQVCVI